MAPKIKITNFPTKGRAEPVRLAFVAGGIEFEDERISGEQIAKRKADGLMPFQSLPTMTVDGEVYAEGAAMLRYAGKLSGLYPKCEKEALRVDMVVDGLETVLLEIFKDKSEAGRTKFVSETMPRYLAPIDAMYAKTKGSFLLGEKMSIADLKLAVLVWFLQSGIIDHVPTNAPEKYSHLMAARKAVEANDKIAAWNAKHKKA